MMSSYSKYAKAAMSLVVSLIVALVAEGVAVKDTMLVNVNSEPSGVYEKVEEKKSRSLSENRVDIKKEKAVEKATKKTVQKATEKATEKASQKATEKATVRATEKTTQKTTQKDVKKSTEKATVSDNKNEASSSGTSARKQLYPLAPTEEATEPEAKSVIAAASADAQNDAGYLIPIANPDYGYSTGQVILSDADRKLACQIVYGEAGGEGFEGCCLVAQCLKDSMVFLGYNSIADVQKYCRYDGWQENYSQTAEDAVNYIFDQNKSAVAHRILFFYATNICTSEWHETQNHVLTRGNSKFFDMW